MLFGGTGFFVDRFEARGSEGIVWLHGYGNVFEKVRDPGESIDVEAGGWIYRDGDVPMKQQVYGLKTGISGGAGSLVFNRFTGPGRVGIQSVYIHLPTENWRAALVLVHQNQWAGVDGMWRSLIRPVSELDVATTGRRDSHAPCSTYQLLLCQAAARVRLSVAARPV
jgi:hypothetical protein